MKATKITKEIEDQYVAARMCLNKADQYLSDISVDDENIRDILDFIKEMQDLANQHIEEADILIRKNKVKNLTE